MDRRSAATGLAVVVAAFVGAVVVVRTAKGPLGFDADAGDPATGADPPAHLLGTPDERLAPSRCVELAPAVVLSDVAKGAIDFGDAAIDASGLVAIGVVRAKDGGGERIASVVTFALGGDGGPVRPALVDLGPSLGDDPPPRPFVLDHVLHAARTETSRDGRRMLVAALGAIEASGALAASPRQEFARFAQTKDESLAFDVASEGSSGLVVWDDDEAGRGVVRVARVPPAPSARDAGSPAAFGVVSPATTDGEAPRVLADPSAGGGAWIAWIARKPELDAGATESAGHFVESPAEAREGRWVEVARVDDRGALRAAVTRLSPGRVSDFDLRRAEGGVDVLMRDEEGVTEARGAKLVRQHVAFDPRAPAHDAGAALAIDPPSVLVTEGVGGADPIVIDDGAAGLLAFVDVAERARIVPIARPGAPAAGAIDAGASAEPTFEGGRVLASCPIAALPVAGRLAGRIGHRADRGAAVIAAGSKQDRAEARILLCER
jgi:hypothetical protein